MLIDTKKSPFSKVYSPSQEDVSLDGGFWQKRFDICADVTIPHILSVFDDKDSFFHQVENFRIAAGLSDGEFRGTPYGDGDFYKLMEGMVYAYAKRGDESIDQKLDEFIDLIGKAQQEDGYISTKQIIGERLSNGVFRHGDVNDFEEYNFGHLFTAACAHKRVTGKDNFMEIALRCAEYLDSMYDDILNKGKAQTAVCPSHYMGLAELYRTTGDKKHLRLLKTAIGLRDLIENGTDDNQDRIPLKEHRKIVGHAVRSTYLYAGVADLYLETGDEELLPVLESCWQNLMDKKIYITGGCGALYTGTSPFGHLMKAQYVHQAFGYEYQLPNVTAYNETCGTLGHIFWANRMFSIDPKAEYLDLIERSYYNLVLAAVSLGGDKYFYENMLRRTKKLDYDVMWPVERKSIFKCFCCPTNLSRSIPQALEYLYRLTDDSVITGMYASGSARFSLKNGAGFTLRQQTNYPWNGKISIWTEDVKADQGFTLKVRIPSWVEKGAISFGGSERTLTRADANSFIEIKIDSPRDARVEIDFDMTAKYMVAHPMVEENVNQVCVVRGPLVYCMESADADVSSIDELFFLSDASFEESEYDIDGHSVIALTTEAATLIRGQHDGEKLYQPLDARGMERRSLRLVPYFAWDNRGFGQMRIWAPIHYNF
jgi:DUF1680 family protein